MAKNDLAESFVETEFVGFIKQNLKFTNQGDVEFTIQVPQRWNSLVMPLVPAFGKPLHFQIQILDKTPTEALGNGSQ